MILLSEIFQSEFMPGQEQFLEELKKILREDILKGIQESSLNPENDPPKILPTKGPNILEAEDENESADEMEEEIDSERSNSIGACLD